VRALLLGVIALVVLFGFDGSRQPTSGNGWRLLATQRASGSPGSVLPIADEPALQAAWKALYLHGDAPAVDFSNVAVYWLTSVGSIACPSRLNGIHVDDAAAMVTASFSLAVTAGCDSNRVPDSFLLAIDRAVLPAGRYEVVVET
jgi:hypothetical protein